MFWSKRHRREEARLVRANDDDFNSSFGYVNNIVLTTKYNALTFVPKNLFEQFQKIANVYFLVLSILQLIPIISSLTYLTTVIPLIVVLAVTGLKDLLEDIQRHKSDRIVNNRMSWVIRKGKLVQLYWCNIVVGDIIRIDNNQFISADMLLLSTSDDNNLCFIETAALDGETNLKARNAVWSTISLHDDVEQLSKFNGEIKCEPPNNNLNKFEGVLKWMDKQYSLTNTNILLRGCILRNTKCCYGLVIYAGRDTKLMQNSGISHLKRTNTDRLLNWLILGIFGFMFLTCLLCAVGCGIWENIEGDTFQMYLPWEDFVPGQKGRQRSPNDEVKGPITIALLVFLSYVILINTAVPISLYVSLEIIRLFHSWLINWDDKMYDNLMDLHAVSRTTILNEELGQISYVFSDKTGTLTRNVMVFKFCSIGGQRYGHEDEQSFKSFKVEEIENVSVESKSSEIYCQLNDARLDKMIIERDITVWEFFRLLALCHTVMPEEKDGKLTYQAQSPDEGALVMAARKFGFQFEGRQTSRICSNEDNCSLVNHLMLNVCGEEEIYQLLAILDFDSYRKRMSVIVKRGEKIMLYCKGADSVIYERLDENSLNIKGITVHHLNNFARKGLRTLCCAAKEINPTYYEQWSYRLESASLLMSNREEAVNELYDEIEQNLFLLGCTAIEDKLQEGVPQTIDRLLCAGMKIWVLTGDKEETAINIGFSCKLLSDSISIFIINANTESDVLSQIDFVRQKIISYSNLDNVSVCSRDILRHSQYCPRQVIGFALVINGCSMVYALSESMKDLFLEVACKCATVICCRTTPIQKADVVHLVKRYKKAITLAIGDGANDVNMIKTAHIGIGISGQEGMQAVLASDFSLPQFRFLARLLLVHGRWSYLRISKFLRYFFYKNFAFTFCHIWFAAFCGFSAQVVYDPLFIAMYNVCFTALPVLFLAFFEQDVSAENSLKYPKLYVPGTYNLYFNTKIFLCSLLEGIVSSLVLFFISYGSFSDAIKPNGESASDFYTFGLVSSTYLIVTVTLRCALETSYWTLFNHIAIWGSIIFYFVLILIVYSSSFDQMYHGTTTHTFDLIGFWLTLVLAVVLMSVPVFLRKLFVNDVRPTLSQTVRLKEHTANIPERTSKRKRKPTLVALKWKGSGYAFSHEKGFGRLITSGSMMTFNKLDQLRQIAVAGCCTIHAEFLQKMRQRSLSAIEQSISFDSESTGSSRRATRSSTDVGSPQSERVLALTPADPEVTFSPPCLVASEDWINEK